MLSVNLGHQGSELPQIASQGRYVSLEFELMFLLVVGLLFCCFTLCPLGLIVHVCDDLLYLFGNFDTTFLYRSNKYAATLPALLLARHKGGKIESIPLANTHAEDIVQIIKNAFLETFVSIFIIRVLSERRKSRSAKDCIF